MSVKILVADDSALDRLIITNMLSCYTVITACDGVEAMRILDENSDVNILILDIKMPNMDGFEVLEAIKANNRYPRLRTLLLTNYDEQDDEIKGLKLGAVDYIRKPIQMDTLIARVNVHVELLQIQETLEQRLNDQELTFDMIFRQAPVGILIIRSSDPDNFEDAVVIANQVFEQITGRPKEDFLKRGWMSFIHPDDLPKSIVNYKKLLAGETEYYSMEERYIKPDRSVVWVNATVAALQTSGDRKYSHICILKDVTERKNYEISLEYNNEHDLLTGLYNRNYLERLLETDFVSRAGGKKALVIIEVSSIGSITRSYGYNYTQKLFCAIADALGQLATDSRRLFRLYEKRFAFYLSDCKDKAEITEFSESIVNLLDTTFKLDRISGGIGIVEIDDDSPRSPDQLFKQLLIASEKAINTSASSFNTCFYDSYMEAQVNREDKIVSALSNIVYDDDDGGLFLQFQPILDLKENRIRSFEALARLQTDELGSVPPLEFISLAEQTKLIIPVGEKIFRQAFLFLNRLLALGYSDLTVSVNISVLQLSQTNFSENLIRMMNEMDVSTKNIVLEITESVLGQRGEINAKLGRLRALGFQISLDDFGTGYSSFARERDLNVNNLKIDKHFINKLMKLEPKDAITSDIISMAHKLGHRAIAEGVEYEKQFEYLRAFDCDMVQGYYISRPLSEDAAIEFLTRWPG